MIDTVLTDGDLGVVSEQKLFYFEDVKSFKNLAAIVHGTPAPKFAVEWAVSKWRLSDPEYAPECATDEIIKTLPTFWKLSGVHASRAGMYDNCGTEVGCIDGGSHVAPRSLDKVVPSDIPFECRMNIAADLERRRVCKLFDVFGDDEQKYLATPLPPEVGQRSKLFTALYKARGLKAFGGQVLTPAMHQLTKQEYLNRFHKFTCHVFTRQGFPWENVCISGGCLVKILNPLYDIADERSDVDIWIFGTKPERQVALNKVIEFLDIPNDTFYAVKGSVIYIFFRHLRRCFQIMVSAYATREEIIKRYDAEYVKWIFNGKDLLGTAGAIRAFHEQRCRVWSNDYRVLKAVMNGYDILDIAKHADIINHCIGHQEAPDMLRLNDYYIIGGDPDNEHIEACIIRQTRCTKICKKGDIEKTVNIAGEFSRGYVNAESISHQINDGDYAPITPTDFVDRLEFKDSAGHPLKLPLTTTHVMGIVDSGETLAFTINAPILATLITNYINKRLPNGIKTEIQPEIILQKAMFANDQTPPYHYTTDGQRATLAEFKTAHNICGVINPDIRYNKNLVTVKLIAEKLRVI